MTLDYGMLLSPEPIRLSIGTLKAPTLRDIAKIGFGQFNFYEVLAKISPQEFYEKLATPEAKEWWESLSDNDRDSITTYGMVTEDEKLAAIFCELFNFFLLEQVTFVDGYFVLISPDVEKDKELKQEDIRGVLSDKTFGQLLNLIQQVCNIADPEEEDESQLKFKNKTARMLYEKMKKAQKEEKKRKNNDINLRLPNIISAVSNRHPTINPINVWDLTIFQLLDAFNRMQNNSMFDINATRVSVWGDEKKKFDPALWYKNHHDSKPDL